ncbi:MAG: hypothetical protein KQA41_01105 [Candidatus Aenigmarchaeota archaeon]|nr:hypothetical protein [Candidatus Aenigmarchaeota archaeon]
MIQFLLGVLFLVLGVFLAFKVIGNLFKTFLVVFILIIGFYLIFGYIPFSDKINLKGFFSLSIDNFGRDKDQNLLLVVKNKWFFEAKNLSVFVDENNVNITNNIKTIGGRKSVILQTDWREDFKNIKIESSIGIAEYSKK